MRLALRCSPPLARNELRGRGCIACEIRLPTLGREAEAAAAKAAAAKQAVEQAAVELTEMEASQLLVHRPAAVSWTLDAELGVRRLLDALHAASQRLGGGLCCLARPR